MDEKSKINHLDPQSLFLFPESVDYTMCISGIKPLKLIFKNEELKFNWSVYLHLVFEIMAQIKDLLPNLLLKFDQI